MRISRTTRKEPTQTKTLQNRYARALQKLFLRYKRNVVELLDDRASMLSVQLDIIGFEKILRQYDVQLITDGAPITEEYARQSFQSGATYAAGALKQSGIESIEGETLADWRAIDQLKIRNLSALRGITAETSKQIIQELTTGMQLGESIPKLRDRIVGRVDHIGKYRATVMARTESINAFTQGAELRYAQAGVEVLEWLTAHDDRLCDACAALDGKTFEVKSRHPRPPLHVQCRCGILPVREQTAIPEPTKQVTYRDVLEKEENIIRNNNYETGIAINKNTGEIVLKKKGTGKSVIFTKDEGKKMEGCVFTHNHPNTGGSFSKADIRAMMQLKIPEMRATTKKYTYVLTCDDPTITKWNSISRKINRTSKEVVNELHSKIRSGEMNVDTANEEHYHLVWDTIFKNNPPFKYTREEVK